MGKKVRRGCRAILVLAALLSLGFLCHHRDFYGISHEDIANRSDLSEVPEEYEPSWSGRFVWTEENENNTFVRFRRTVTLTEQDFAEPLLAAVAADSRYWLYINGEIVVREGGEKRGVTPNSTYYDTLNLTNYLRVGENTIAALVWYYGPDVYNMSYASSGQGAFYFELHTAMQTVTTDETWRASRDKAYSNLRNEANYRLAEKDIFYFGFYDERWMMPSYDDRAWETATEVSVLGELPEGELVPRKIPLFRNYGLKDYENSAAYEGYRANGSETREGMDEEFEELTLRLPYNAQFTPYLEVQTNRSGQVIEIFTDSYYDANGLSTKCWYVTKRGRQAFESPAWLSGETVTYRIPNGVKVLRLQYREIGYDTDIVGSFTSDDEFYDALYQKAARTLYVCMHDTYLDCPNRERAQWFADLAVEMTEANYALDENADALYRAGIDTTLGWATEDNALLATVPSSSARNEMPLQMLMGFCSYWDYYLATGDLSFLEEIYEPTKRYLSFWDFDGDGNLAFFRNAPYWNWGDSTENTDETLLQMTWVSYALSEMEKIAGELGKTEDITAFEAKRERIAERFETYWTEDNGYFSDATLEPDERVQAVAVLSGLADESRYEKIAEIFETQFHATPLLEYYVESACVKIGRPELAEGRMKLLYEPMVTGEDAGSTLWEYWRYGQGTANHAWSGGPLILMTRDFAGIQNLAPGDDIDVLLEPSLGEIDSLSCTARTRKGLIRVEISRDAESFTLTLRQPTGMTSLVRLKDYDYEEIVTTPETTITLSRK